MIPVVRVLAERAEARRQSLLGLAAVVPPDFWTRTAPGDAWSAQLHLAHALSSDAVLAELLARLEASSGALLLDEGSMLAARQSAIDEAARLEVDQLVAFGLDARNRLLACLSSLSPAALERMLVIGSQRSAWPGPLTLTGYAYLEQWAGHDASHEAAIRLAISSHPNLSAVAHVRRLR